MGREQNRKRDQILKSKLTDAQFQELKSQAIDEKVQEGIDRFIGNFVVVFKPVMKEFKISSERAEKVIKEIYDRAWANYLNGDPGEDRHQEMYLDQEKFITAATNVLSKSGCPDKLLKSISVEIYDEVLKVTRGE